MKRPLVLALAVVVPVAACDGFKEAMTAHVDVAARAGSQELSVTRLGDLLGASKIPLRRDVVQTVADMWVNYQLLARAAAHNDSLNQAEVIDEAMWPATTNTRIKKFYDQVAKSWGGADTAGNAAAYASGKLLAARHILVNAQPGAGPAADSALKKAQAIRAQLTSANFAEMANKYNQPNAAGPGGDLGVFPKEQMVAEFGNALAALKPGEISQPVRSQFGYHIIRRSTYDEVKDQFSAANNQTAARAGESTYVAKLNETSKVVVKPNAPAVVKAVASAPDAHRDDKTVIATSTMGDFTAARAAKWITAFPNPPQLRQQIQQAPDSALPEFVKAIVRNELLLRQADSAKVTLDTAETNEIRRAFVGMVANTWSGLNISPNRLADSAKTVAERERLAAARVDDYMERLLTKDEQFVPIQPTLESALHSKYDYKVNAAGIDRALEKAQRIRTVADSTKAAQQPPSAVPLPGGQPGAAPSAPAPDTTKKP
ncbi:MAG TPA: peptidylprolyl isomerase [Gemmatimonadaceae bacterium]|nr:peptidylprolyl isomerase [Gemmatimonadaceae bacterium]